MTIGRIEEARNRAEEIEGRLGPVRERAVGLLEKWGRDEFKKYFIFVSEKISRRLEVELPYWGRFIGDYSVGGLANVSFYRSCLLVDGKDVFGDGIYVTVTSGRHKVDYVLKEDLGDSTMTQKIPGEKKETKGWESCLELGELFDMVERHLIEKSGRELGRTFISE